MTMIKKLKMILKPKNKTSYAFLLTIFFFLTAILTISFNLVTPFIQDHKVLLDSTVIEN